VVGHTGSKGVHRIDLEEVRHIGSVRVRHIGSQVVHRTGFPRILPEQVEELVHPTAVAAGHHTVAEEEERHTAAEEGVRRIDLAEGALHSSAEHRIDYLHRCTWFIETGFVLVIVLRVG
jgi:hypothetical protein